MRTRRAVLWAGAAAVLVVPFAPSAVAAPAYVDQAVGVPVHVDLQTTLTCDNNGGTVSAANQIEIGGSVTVGSVTTAIWFQNNDKGTQKTGTVTEGVVQVTPLAPAPIVIPKQPVPADGISGVGAGGNPWISFDIPVKDAQGAVVHNPDGSVQSAIGGPFLIGKCVQSSKGGFTLSHVDDFTVPTQVSTLVQALRWTKSGSELSVTQNDAFPGVDALLLFDNNKNYVVHEAGVSAALTFHLVGAIHTSKGWGAGGAGGNPLVRLQFLGAGTEMGAGCTPVGDPVTQYTCDKTVTFPEPYIDLGKFHDLM